MNRHTVLDPSILLLRSSEGCKYPPCLSNQEATIPDSHTHPVHYTLLLATQLHSMYSTCMPALALHKDASLSFLSISGYPLGHILDASSYARQEDGLACGLRLDAEGDAKIRASDA